MVRNRKLNRNPKDKGYIPGEYDIRGKQDATIPTKDRINSDSNLLGKTAFRDLSFAKPITVQANPTAEATKAAVPYAIINGTNPIWEADYPGSSNLAGNTLPLLNNSNKSKLLNSFDAGKIDLRLKYLYAAIKPTDINQSLNVQLGKSVTEALAKAYSETYIQMPFFKDKVTSSMINCDDTTNYTQLLIWYQTMLQNISSVTSKYNMAISLEQHLKDSCYNRDVAPLDDLFGLLRKNSFRSKINAFSNIITGEYFDLSWYKQMNTLTIVPSRRTNSMRDPLLTIDAIHDIPDIKVEATDDQGNITGTVLDSENYKISIPANSGTPIDGAGPVRFEEVILIIQNMLNPYNILKWARQLSNRMITTTPTQYFNAIVTLLEAVRSTLSRFPADVSDIRAVLEVANRSNLNRWTKGVYFDVTREMYYQPVFNKLCHDVFVNYLASPDKVYYDDSTLRWKFYSVWDEYLGLPKFDRVNGGAFLSFSTRTFEDDVVPSTDTKYLIPKLFDIHSDSNANAEFVNRLGVTAEIGYTVYDSQDIENSTVYSRLNSLSFKDYDQRIPTADLATGYENIPQIGSAVNYLLTRLFSFGNIKVDSDTTNESLNNDIVSIVDIEMDDVSNSMIAFAQAYAPFKVYTPVTERTVGFKEIPNFGG